MVPTNSKTTDQASSTLDELQHLSVVKKVTSTIFNHLGINDSVLAEFIINIAKKNPELKNFENALKKIDAEFEPSLISALHRVITSMLPLSNLTKMDKIALKNKNNENNDKLKNDNLNAKNQAEISAKKFPALAIPDSKPISILSEKEKKALKETRNKKRIEEEKLLKKFRGRNREIKLNEIYEGTISNIRDFGFFVRLKGVKNFRQEGLVHISMVRVGRVHDLRQEVKRNQKVFVKIISIVGSKIGLSMRMIDQKTGEDKSKNDPQNNRTQKTSKFSENSEFSKNLKINALKASKKRLRLSSPERWELAQLRNSGVLQNNEGALNVEGNDFGALNDEIDLELDSDVEENLDIEVNDAEPPFLLNQTGQSVALSPIRVAKNPDGSLSRSALAQSALSKERRELRDQALKTAEEESALIDIGRSWEDPMASKEERYLAQQLHGVQKKGGRSQTWRHQSIGRNTSYGRVTNLTIKEQRETLPIFKLREKLLNAIRENDIIVVIGATGSGKTTQMTQYLVESGFSRKGKIGCTQPRRVAAMSVAKRVAEEFGCRLGQEIGYAIRFEDCTSPETIIKYMTDGMLLREALLDKYLKDYSVIILDEAHERTVHTDVLFGLMKKCVSVRKDMKLIVTSATLDAAKFATYFNECPIFTIPGRLFPTTIMYSKEPEPDYVDAAMMTVMQIHLSEPPGDILLFLTGKEEIDSTCEKLFERMRQLGPEAPELIILPVYSALPAELQSRIFEPAPPGKRKCVVATNIAEASLTIDGIFYVVDPGFVKQKVYNPKLGLDSLVITPISQASADQRAGRSGRTGPGQCYRLYTEAAYESEMLECSVPEIQRTNLGNIVLTLKAMGINDLLHFDFMDPPPAQTLIAAMQALYALGALDDEGLLTRLGRKMAEFPLEPMQSKILIQSVDFGCSEEVLIIVAMLSADNIWFRPREKQSLADSRRAAFCRAEGDHLTLLTVYREWERHSFSNAWCIENFVQTRAMRRAQDVRKQLAMIMDRYNLDIVSCGRNFTRVRRAITSGYFRHVAKKDPQEGYKTLLEGQQVYIHPSSALFNRKPPWVIYHHLMLTSKEYMREVLAIDPKWLVELAPRSFRNTDPSKLSRQKKREKIEPLFDPKCEDQDAWRLSKRVC